MIIICLFLPAVIATLIDCKIENNKFKFINIGAIYLCYVFFINLIMNTILWCFATDKLITYSNSMFTYNFCLKYMWVVFFVSMVLPFIKKLLIDKLSIKIIITKKNK